MLRNYVIFASGGLTGAAICYFIMKKQRREICDAYQEEIDRLVELKHQKVLAEQNDILKSNLNFDELVYSIGSEKKEIEEIEINAEEDATEAEIIENFTEGSSQRIPITPARASRRGHMEEKYNSKKAMMDRYEDAMEDEPFDEDLDDLEGEDPGYEDNEGYIPTYPKEGPSPDPYPITPDQFLGDAHLDKVTLTYYLEDDILIDEDERDVTNEIFNTVGYEFDEYFGRYLPDTAYIRNDMNGTDYEICLRHGSYSFDSVM